MRLIKFISDYVKDDILIQRNSIYEYVDKREVLITDECGQSVQSLGLSIRLNMKES